MSEIAEMRERLATLADAQKIAVAIEMAQAVSDPREAEGLLRLALAAEAQADGLMRAVFSAFEREGE